MRVGMYLRWAPFVVATVLSGIVALDRSPDQAVATFIGQLFLLLPPAAMVAAGGTRSRRGAFAIGLAAMMTMAILDIAPVQGPGAAGPVPDIAVGPDDRLMPTLPQNDWLGPGAIARALRVLPEGAFLRGNPELEYYFESDLAVAARVLLKLAYLLVPFGLIGWALGLESWMRRRVTFARPVDAVVARVVLEVGIAMFAVWLSVGTAFRSMTGVLWGGDPAWTTMVPMVLVFVTGLPGWLRPREERASSEVPLT